MKRRRVSGDCLVRRSLLDPDLVILALALELSDVRGLPALERGLVVVMRRAIAQRVDREARLLATPRRDRDQSPSPCSACSSAQCES